MKMEDIARMAGVSKSAVSLALSGKTGISQETREKILKIVKETGYIPRSLVKAEQVYGTGTTNNTLRLLVFTNSGIILEQYYKQPFFMELIQYIEEACRAQGYSLMFSAVDINEYVKEIQTLENEASHSGIILLGTNLNRQQIEEIASIQPNLVVLDNYEVVSSVDFVVMNNVMGAYQAASFLYEQGHRHIGYIQSDTRMHNFDSRKKGFFRAKDEFGFVTNDEDVFTLSPTILSSQSTFVEQITKMKQQNRTLPSAFFCEADYLAISIIKSFYELGIRVPEDVSVVGFDNISEAVVITPELTTIHVEKEMMAVKAVHQLIDLIENKNKRISMKTVVDTKLIERRSCKKV